jgi:hypothetical protein
MIEVTRSGNPEHKWYDAVFKSVTITACRYCGIVKNKDGENKPCTGIATIKFR